MAGKGSGGWLEGAVEGLAVALGVGFLAGVAGGWPVEVPVVYTALRSFGWRPERTAGMLAVMAVVMAVYTGTGPLGALAPAVCGLGVALAVVRSDARPGGAEHVAFAALVLAGSLPALVLLGGWGGALAWINSVAALVAGAVIWAGVGWWRALPPEVRERRVRLAPEGRERLAS